MTEDDKAPPRPATDPGSAPPPLPEWRDYYTVMAHFYRGEIGRAMVWRQRLDVTTNWAIGAVTGIVTYGLGHSEAPHVVFLFACFLVLLLLVIEARRYRFYDAFRARVRMLEAHLIMPVVAFDAKMLAGDWREAMAGDLILPSLKIGHAEAVCHRFRRNYGWIFLILTFAWALKIWRGAMPGDSVRAALERGLPFSPWLFWPVVGLLYGLLLATLIGSFQFPNYSGEFSSSRSRRERWRI